MTKDQLIASTARQFIYVGSPKTIEWSIIDDPTSWELDMLRCGMAVYRVTADGQRHPIDVRDFYEQG